jgi:endo-1,4-beta-xylanase
MVSFSSLVLAASAVVSVFAAPTDLAIRSRGELAERAITSSQTGTNNGFYYSVCK